MKRSSRNAALATTLIGMTISCKTPSTVKIQADASATQDASTPYKCGRPLVVAWDAHKKTNYSQLDQKAAFAAISKENMNDLIKLVGPMTADEKILYTASLSLNPVPVVNRGYYANLKRLLTSQAKSIEAPNAPRAKAAGIQPEITPQSEDELYGALNCVFATVGPPDGRTLYGDVIFRFKNREPVPAFGTLRAGDPYMWGSPGKTMAEYQYGYVQMLVAPVDWDEWFAYSLVKLLRDKGAAKSKMIAELNKILVSTPLTKRRSDFWQYVFDQQLGYLEGKYENTVSITAMESIEVDASVLKDIAGWQLPANVMALIKAKTVP